MDLQNIKDEKGRNGSRVLPPGIKNYLIDIDGTICDDIPNEEPERMATAEEIPNAKNMINSWYDEGHIITFFTSRTEKENGDITRKWLHDHGFKYHGIMFGKPRGGNYHWIDDRGVRATRFNGKFTNLVKRNQEILVFEDDL
jgi:hypothetical protein